MIRAAVTGVLLLAMPAGAEERPIAPDAFRDAHVGAVLDYVLPDGGAFGREYWPSRDRTIWRGADGDCMTCAVRRVGARLCFDCDGGTPSCWTHSAAPDGRVLIRSDAGLQAFGARVLAAPPYCASVPMSRAPSARQPMSPRTNPSGQSIRSAVS